MNAKPGVLAEAACKRCGGSGQIGSDRHSIWVCPVCYEYPTEAELEGLPTKPGVLVRMDNVADQLQAMFFDPAGLVEARTTIERLAEAMQLAHDAMLLADWHMPTASERKREAFNASAAALAAFRGEG